ncbi:MAG: SDR family NAD(P)-dependent oxidoreductase [Actinomycetota bacterium]
MSTELFSLEGKTAIVTGASRGIGRSIALGFARAGADVALAARTAEDLDEVAGAIVETGRRVVSVPTDVTDRTQIEALVERTVAELGKLDILVNNTGGTRFVAPLVSLRPDGWTKAIALNLDSVFHATQLGARAMLETGGGSIVQISSVAGIQGAQGLSYYSAAKGGVRLFSQAAAKELASSGVRVNVISPGWVATDLNANLRVDDATSRVVTDMIPMARWGRPEDIVGAALFLASDASSFVTGTTVVVDGGQTA